MVSIVLTMTGGEPFQWSPIGNKLKQMKITHEGYLVIFFRLIQTRTPFCLELWATNEVDCSAIDAFFLTGLLKLSTIFKANHKTFESLIR